MNKITKVTRKGILLDLLNEKTFDLEKIILNFFDSDKLPSYDSRFSNMSGDYHQHRINNNDREDNWFIEDDRLNLYGVSDEEFLKLICLIVHPENISDEILVSTLIKNFNNKLLRDGFEIIPNGNKISGLKLYKGNQFLGGENELIFYTSIREDYTFDTNINGEPLNIPYFTGEKKYPCINLGYDNWDDFGWKTTFSIKLLLNRNETIDLGYIKILGPKLENFFHTILPVEFKHLDDSFCSAFLTEVSYKNLDKPPAIKYKNTILKSLNDVTHNKNILLKFKDNEGFKTSLMRNSEIYTKTQNIISSMLVFGIKTDNGMINFNFDEGKLPHRINVLIGKNGSGKTRLLTSLTNEILKYNPEFSKLNIRPTFGKVIQVSYSVFDTFPIPKTDEQFQAKYIYCGLRDEENRVSIDSLRTRFLNSLNYISETGKQSVYTYLVSDLLDSNKITFEQIQQSYQDYSSGQKILITIIAEIIVHIQENTLLLFDEPETHLHPNMIFKLIKVLYTLLDDNKSYLILATHSPIILQQIPSKFVQVLDSYGNRSLSIESFGENFSGITKEIFGNYEEEDLLYKEIFDKLADKFTEEEIIGMFENGLNLNARIYLKTVFNNKNTGKQ